MISLITALVPSLMTILEKVVPDKDERAKLAHDIATQAERQAHDQIMAQVEVNKQEAAHKSLFVAGWRPFTGWACGLALANNFIVVPYLAAFGLEIVPLNLEVMLPVLLGMLGLGGMRSYEKRNGVSRER
jgi:hypothetical protein